MLDTDTKRRIDTARDILVGKVPDPKSQVEQITIALIYKFMDDMDAANCEFNLSGERYREGATQNAAFPHVRLDAIAEIEGYQKIINGARAVLDNSRPHIPIHPDWPVVELGEVFKLSSGRGLTQTQMKDGPYPVYGGNGKNGSHAEYFVENPIIVIGHVGAYCGAVHVTEPKSWVTDNGLYVTEYKQKIDQNYLAQALTQLNLNQYAKVGGQPSISQTTVYECCIPLPPFATQKAIVAEIEAEQALVAANRELIARFEKKIQKTLGRVWGAEAS